MRILKTLFTALAAAVLMLGGLFALVATVATAAVIFIGRSLFRPTRVSPVPPSRGPRQPPAPRGSDIIDVSATEVPDGRPTGDPSQRVGVASDRR